MAIDNQNSTISQHTEVVESLYLDIFGTISRKNTRWDKLFMETEKYEDHLNINESPGEVDLALIDEEEETAWICEVKTGDTSAKEAKKQLSKIEEAFENARYDVILSTYIKPKDYHMGLNELLEGIEEEFGRFFTKDMFSEFIEYQKETSHFGRLLERGLIEKVPKELYSTPGYNFNLLDIAKIGDEIPEAQDIELEEIKNKLDGLIEIYDQNDDIRNCYYITHEGYDFLEGN